MQEDHELESILGYIGTLRSVVGCIVRAFLKEN